MKEVEKIFLMCSERSGSNFISRMLNAHSRICSPPPKHIFNPLLRNLYRYEPLLHNWDAVLEDTLAMYNAKFTIWNNNLELSHLKNNVEPGNITSLINYIFDQEALLNGKDYLFIKENKIYEFFPFLLMNYSKSKYVFQVRDPRDMALSWRENPTHPGGVVSAAKQWKEDQQNSLKNAQLLKATGNILIVKYEDLVDVTIDKLKEIVGFIGVDFEKSMLDYHKEDQNKKNSNLQHAWTNLSKGVIKGNFNKYKTKLTEQEIAYIEKICFFEMSHLGYVPENSWDELISISQDEINNYEKTENLRHPQNLTDGVKENIAAKTTFYQKNI